MLPARSLLRRIRPSRCLAGAFHHKSITHVSDAYQVQEQSLMTSSRLRNEEEQPKGESEPNACDIDDVREKILDYALDHVTNFGWTRNAISRGAEDAGYAGVAEGMFENEGADLVMHFVKQSNINLNLHLQEIVANYPEEKINVNDFIRDAIKFRLQMIIPYISRWPQAMTMLLSPTILPRSTSALGHMVDDIWHLAGDKSADFNWYTKRGILTKLFISTQLYMIRDQSPDFEDTWKFLDRR